MSLADRLQRAWRDDDALAQALRPLAALHGALIRLRVLLYRLGFKRAASLPVPVIVVGNWIVGGAGKTPTTLALLRRCAALGLRAGVISRGYGRSDETLIRVVSGGDSATEVGDEPLLIQRRAGVPVAVGRDRVATARALLAAHPDLQVLISDDGLQHWRLPRQLSVLVFDERGLGNGRLLPAGPLRQNRPLAAAPGSSSEQLVLYNAPQASTALTGHLAQRRLAGAVRLKDWWAGQPATLQALQALCSARARPLLAAAGMAAPQRFFAMLREQGLVIDELPLPDHYRFDTLPWPADTPTLLITEKDAVKLLPERLHGTEVWVVTLDFSPEQAFEQALDSHLARLLNR
ncbi:tetraacyldisaccharide 4'-kinase [Paucibacter sp. APW11]|uniref:Tetraacyldisaccharide 4'-kinase n=1 Tax=Roseateles aquae TaxID=3077235 RepID=A0ABU3P9D9_9BURK|nr:tetraacyldisaccharide 4'-kinase [Paucibacter sp. APW11]MDT8999184.1 tetraacyldisaccharide 4'-kinase [Paucibacter sp. APW11]